MLKKYILIALFSLSLKAEITPSEVYWEALKIDSEIELIKRELKIDKKHNSVDSPLFDIEFKPRHNWYLAYMLNVKVNLLRHTLNLPRVEEVGIEPVLNLKPDMVYGMLKRLSTEILIVKRILDIESDISKVSFPKSKTPKDVFNILMHISKELDNLIGTKIDPSSVFAQVMRFYSDVDFVLKYLNINDNTTPPPKKRHLEPKDAFLATKELLREIARLQRGVDIERTNFSKFTKETIEPEDTFILVELALAEFQTIKAYIGLERFVTPPAIIYTNKTPSDVEQLILWLVKRLKLIEDIDR